MFGFIPSFSGRANNSKNMSNANDDSFDEPRMQIPDIEGRGLARADLLKQKLRNVINLVDKLRDCDIQKSIKLPQIAVIGQQSAGKSSLLESLVRLNFLPRGEGMVTKRPLLLCLNRLSNERPPYAIFEDDKNHHEEDFNKVKEKIQALMNGEEMGDQEIIDKPIKLAIYSPHCPDLTLIDLPGVTKISKKDPRIKLEDLTRNISKKYIEGEENCRTIVLGICPATDDITNAEAVSLCPDEKGDARGQRSLFVLTKIDEVRLPSKHETIIRTLNNKELTMKQGFIGVINLTQEDVANNKTIEQKEAEFFQNNPHYQSVKHLIGVEVLSTKLSTLLHNSIIEHLPNIRAEVDDKIKEYEQRRERLGESLPTESHKMIAHINKIIEAFVKNVNNVRTCKLKKDGDKTEREEEEDEVSFEEEVEERKEPLSQEEKNAFQGEAKFRFILGDFLKKKDALFKERIKGLEKEIQVSVEILLGKEVFLTGFLPKRVVKAKVKRLLEEFKKLATSFVDEVLSLNVEMVKLALLKMEHIHRGNKRSLNKQVSIHLEELKKKILQLLDQILESESNMIWWDERFEVKSKALLQDEPMGTQKILKRVKNQISALMGVNVHINKVVEKNEVKLFKAKVTEYYGVLNFSLGNTVTKVVGAKLIKTFCDTLKTYLYENINTIKEDFENERNNDPLETERKRLDTEINNLNKAKGLLEDFNY